VKGVSEERGVGGIFGLDFFWVIIIILVIILFFPGIFGKPGCGYRE